MKSARGLAQKNVRNHLELVLQNVGGRQDLGEAGLLAVRKHLRGESRAPLALKDVGAQHLPPLLLVL